MYEKFYPNGSIKIQKSADSTKKYYENGNLLELFDYSSNCAVFYDKDDKWILRHRADEDHQLSMNGEKITFHDEVCADGIWDFWKRRLACLKTILRYGLKRYHQKKGRRLSVI